MNAVLHRKKEITLFRKRKGEIELEGNVLGGEKEKQREAIEEKNS